MPTSKIGLLVLLFVAIRPLAAQSELFIGLQSASPLINDRWYQRKNMPLRAVVPTIGFGWQKTIQNGTSWTNKLELRYSASSNSIRVGTLTYLNGRSTIQPGTLTKNAEAGLRYEMEFRQALHPMFEFTFGGFADFGHLSETFIYDSIGYFQQDARHYAIGLGAQAGLKYNIGKSIYLFSNGLLGARPFAVDHRRTANPALTPRQQSSTVFDFDIIPIIFGIRLGVGYTLPQKSVTTSMSAK
jgi:hypothetical protein